MAMFAPAIAPPDPEKNVIPGVDVSRTPTLNSSNSSVQWTSASPGEPVYRYLTFDTPLPTPNPASTKGSLETRPPPPNLKKYEDPRSWHWIRKAISVTSAVFGCLMAAYSSAAYAFGLAGIESEFQLSTNVANIGITAYNLGFAVTPMLFAPLSESVGRYPLFVGSGFLFVITNLTCGLTTTFAGLIVSRFLAGCGASTFSTIIGGVISDLYDAKDRNTPMACFASSTMIGVGVGLSISGALAQTHDWRWIFYVQTILTAAPFVAVTLFMKESRGSVVLQRRANVLNKWYEALEDAGFVGVEVEDSGSGSSKEDGSNAKDGEVRYVVIRWKVEATEKRPAMLKLVWVSLVRPFHMLFTEPVVFFFSLWAMFAWSILYMTFESVPLVFRTSHGFNDYENGLVFTSMIVGTLIVLPACIAWDKRQRSGANAEVNSTPESRLFLVCVLSACMPIGLFWFGWTQFGSIPWIVPVMAIACLTIGFFTIYLSTFNYFADVYGLYASSAMAATSFCRNVVSSVFPFFANTAFINLGFGQASSLLGGIGVVLMIAPVLLLLNGPRIRARSNYT